MAETIAEYTARLKGYVQGQDPLAVQHKAYESVASVMKELPEGALDRERLPGHWSARQILAHLADVEVANSWRYRQILENTGVALAAYDQDEWAKLGDYATVDANESLEVFRLLRSNNLRLLARLTPQQWQRFGMHAERGRMTLQELALQIAGHDLNHIAQLREIVASTRAAKPV